MSKLQIVVIFLLILGILGFGFLAYQKWQAGGSAYSFQGYVYKVDGNKLIVDAPMPTAENGRTILKSKRITVDTGFMTTFEKIDSKQNVTTASIADIKGQDTSLVSSQVNVFTRTDPKNASELSARRIQITKDFTPLPPGAKTNLLDKK